MAISLNQIRESNPDLYEGIDDDSLAKHLHETYYSDLDFPTFAKAINYNDPNGPGVIQSNVTIPLMKGGAGMIGATGEALSLAGVEDTGRFLQDRAAEYNKLFTEQQSVDAQKAAQEGIKFTDENGDFQLPSGSAVSQAAFESLPSMVGMGLIGAPVAGALTKATGAVLPEATNALTKFLAGTAPSAIGYGASEGVISGLQNADQTETKYRQTPIEEFYDVPAFLDAFSNETDPTKSDLERANEARDIVARKAGKEVFEKTAVSTGGIGIATGGGGLGMLARDNPASGLLTKLAKGAITEGPLQEGPQSYYEQKIQNIADKKYLDPSIDPNAGAMDAAISGSTIGSIMGLVSAGAGHVASPNKDNVNAVAKIGGAQSVDDAIAAQTAAVTKMQTPTENKANPTQYEPSFESAASKYGVPMDFLKAVAMQESGIRQFDKNGKPMNPGTSSALGVMQIIPKWHPQYDPTKLAQDADYNIHAGAEFLGELLKKHNGDMKAAAMDYYGSKNPEENAKYAAGVLSKMQTKNFPNNGETKPAGIDEIWPDVQQVVSERTIPERAGGLLAAINDQYRDSGYVPGEQGQVWEKPTAEIKPPRPDAEGIVRDNTVPGKDILQTITDQYRESGYIPGEQGQVWEKPTAEIKPPKSDVEGIVRDNTIPGKDVQQAIDERYQAAGYIPGEQGQVWEKPTAEIKQVESKQTLPEGKPVPQEVLSDLKSTTTVESKQPWEMTREEFKSEFPGFKDSAYDETLHSAYGNDKITKDQLDSNVIYNYAGQKELWAKSRAELEQEKKDIVKSGRKARSDLNRTPIHSAKWANRSESNKAKLNIEADARYADTLLKVHKDRVAEALTEGKPVPQEVLNDYPDLKPTITENTNAKSEVQPISSNTGTDRTGNGEVVPNAESKQPWEMTREEFVNGDNAGQSPYERIIGATDNRRWRSEDRAKAEGYHKYIIVKQALVEGKPVPQEVLNDYPDLKPTEDSNAKSEVQPIPSNTGTDSTGNAEVVPNAEGAATAGETKEQASIGPKNAKEIKQETNLPYGEETKQETALPSAGVTDTTKGMVVALPSILTLSKAKYLKQANTEYNKANPNVSKAIKENAHKSFIDNYDTDVEKAQAALSFDDYKALAGNKSVPDGLLKQSHDQLRADYGTTNAATTGTNRVGDGERLGTMGSGVTERVEDNTGDVGEPMPDNLPANKVPLAEDYPVRSKTEAPEPPKGSDKVEPESTKEPESTAIESHDKIVDRIDSGNITNEENEPIIEQPGITIADVPKLFIKDLVINITNNEGATGKAKAKDVLAEFDVQIKSYNALIKCLRG